MPLIPSRVEDLQDIENKLDLEAAIEQEINLSRFEWKNNIQQAIKYNLDRGYQANFMILDESFLFNSNRFDQFEKDFLPYNMFTVLINFRHDDAPKIIKDFAASGGKGIKFHPYLQKITKADFAQVLEICKLAQKWGLIINVDCSYGTLELFDNNGVELIAYILKSISEVPVVCLHFGGPRILDVCMLAHAAENLYVDLSLSLEFWKGSSVIDNLAFSMKKLGSERFLFGSDNPFVKQRKALTTFHEFCSSYNISEDAQKNILCANSERIMSINQ